MIHSAGQPEERPDPKKPTDSARSSWGLDCESSDYIKGCDGACIHAVSFLAGAGGWNITNVAAFTIFPVRLFGSFCRRGNFHYYAECVRRNAVCFRRHQQYKIPEFPQDLVQLWFTGSSMDSRLGVSGCVQPVEIS